MRIKQDKILEKYPSFECDGGESLFNQDHFLYKPKMCYDNSFVLVIRTFAENHTIAEDMEIKGVFGYVLDTANKLAKRHCWMEQTNRWTRRIELVDVTFFTEECSVLKSCGFRYIGLKKVTPAQWLAHFNETKEAVMWNVEGEEEFLEDLKESGYTVMSDLDVYKDGMFKGVEIQKKIC